jgi:pimeloyl-ACP methyl ester carboxylesterase
LNRAFLSLQFLLILAISIFVPFIPNVRAQNSLKIISVDPPSGSFINDPRDHYVRGAVIEPRINVAVEYSRSEYDGISIAVWIIYAKDGGSFKVGDKSMIWGGGYARNPTGRAEGAYKDIPSGSGTVTLSCLFTPGSPEDMWPYYVDSSEGKESIQLKVVVLTDRYMGVEEELEDSCLVTYYLRKGGLGVVADGVSSAEIRVKTPTTESRTITLTDGKIQLTQSSMDGVAVFKYIPDTKALELTPDKIPKEGADITLKPSLDDGTPLEPITLKVYRKPVLLIHGIWSSAKTWGKTVPRLESDGFNVYTLDYEEKNVDDPRDTAQNYLLKKIDQIKTDYIAKGINCSKIDVLAHSMGGVITRYFMIMEGYWRGTRENVESSVSKLITVGTPYKGSPGPQQFVDAISKGGAFIDWIDSHVEAGAMGKPGEAVREMMPGSTTVNAINSRPKPPNVKIYAIVGTNNFLGNMELSRTPDGDGIVDIESQKHAGDEVYYVYEWHMSECQSHDVFIIASNILKDLEVPSTYRSPSSPTLTLSLFLSTKDPKTDTPKFVIGSDKKLVLSEGEEIKDFTQDIFIACLPTEQAAKDDRALARLDVSKKSGERLGTLLVRATPQYEGPIKSAKINVLRAYNPTTFVMIPSLLGGVIPTYELDYKIKHEGPLIFLSLNFVAVSLDPEFTISMDRSNRTNIVVLDGNLTITDNHNGTAFVTKGQQISVDPEGRLGTPTVADLSTLDKWWKEIEETTPPPPPQQITIEQIAIVGIIAVVLTSTVLIYKKRGTGVREQPSIEAKSAPPQQYSYCEECGRKIRLGTKYCTQCGDQQGVA